MMDMEQILRVTLVMMNKMHILGEETGVFEAAKRNIKTVAEEMKRMKEAQAHDEAGNAQQYILPRGSELTISIESAEPLSEIAGSLEGMGVIRVTEEENPNVTHMYEEYTELTSIRRTSSGRVHVTLSKK